MLEADKTTFSIDWLTHTFDLGEPYNVFQAGCGQTNKLGVLRLKTSLGLFAIKRSEQAVAKDLDWAFLLQNKISILVEWEVYILSNTVNDEPYVPSQKDLHPPNVIRCFNGNHVVVDWDDAGQNSPPNQSTFSPSKKIFLSLSIEIVFPF